MKVKDLLKDKKREIVTVEGSTDILTAMELLIKNKISCLPVLGYSGQLVGIISDKDIFHAIYENQDNFPSIKVSNLMTTDLLVGLAEDEIDYIGGVMTENKVRHIPIVEKDRLVGLISLGDIVKAEIKQMQIENRYLKLYMEGNYPG
jgi:CBS domain-containing protein